MSIWINVFFINSVASQKFHDKQQVVYNSFPLSSSLEKLLSTFLLLLLTLNGYDKLTSFFPSRTDFSSSVHMNIYFLLDSLELLALSIFLVCLHWSQSIKEGLEFFLNESSLVVTNNDVLGRQRTGK